MCFRMNLTIVYHLVTVTTRCGEWIGVTEVRIQFAPSP